MAFYCYIRQAYSDDPKNEIIEAVKHTEALHNHLILTERYPCHNDHNYATLNIICLIGCCHCLQQFCLQRCEYITKNNDRI